jgi:hypothetical protein
MAFAPHTNNVVRHQLRMGQIPTPDPLVLGCFKHRETNTLFEFAERRWHDDLFAPAACHVIYTLEGPRLARVLKTVAHVVVDEDENGPIWEHWQIKQYREYDTEWVRA